MKRPTSAEIYIHVHTKTQAYMHKYIHTCMRACMHTYIHTYRTYIFNTRTRRVRRGTRQTGRIKIAQRSTHGAAWIFTIPGNSASRFHRPSKLSTLFLLCRATFRDNPTLRYLSLHPRSGASRKQLAHRPCCSQNARDQLTNLAAGVGPGSNLHSTQTTEFNR